MMANRMKTVFDLQVNRPLNERKRLKQI